MPPERLVQLFPLAQATDHLIETIDQQAEFIGAQQLDTRIQISFGNLARRMLQLTDRCHDQSHQHPTGHHGKYDGHCANG